jgi:hypothetical protein
MEARRCATGNPSWGVAAADFGTDVCTAMHKPCTSMMTLHKVDMRVHLTLL